MAYAWDVDGRLAEGEAAVADFDTYLAACAALGHSCSGRQLSHLYGGEYGLDLRALDSDCRALVAAAHAAQDVLVLQDNTSRDTTAMWSGAGGAAAAEFLNRQNGSAQTVIAGLRGAADALTTLRDELWLTVDAKVSAVLAAADRAATHRAVWTSAAHVVLGGGGDQSVASEIVEQQVAPFVDAVVCGELLPALGRFSEDVVAKYDSALSALTDPSVAFELPGELTPPPSAGVISTATTASIGSAAAGGAWPVPQAVRAASVETVPTTVPQAVLAAPPAAPPAVAPAPAAADPVLAAPAAPAAAPSLPDLGLGSAAGGFGRQLTDALGGALGSAAGLLPDATGLGDVSGGLDGDRAEDADDAGRHEDEDPDDDPEKSDDDDPEKSDDEHRADDTPPQPVPEAASASEESGAPPQPPEGPATPVLPPAPVSPPEMPAAPASAEPASGTPCQIAADQLPQVGA